MKKTIFLFLFLFSISYVYSQFEGYMEVKMTDKKVKVKSKSDESQVQQGMDEAVKMIKQELKDREEKLKGMKAGDEGYDELKAEIDALKTQLKSMTGGAEDTEKETDETPKVEITKFYFMPKAVRFEQGEDKSSGMGGVSILRTDSRKIIILDASKKQYFELDFDFMKSMMSKMKEMGMNKEDKSKGKAEVKKTGETKTILGYKCEKWLMSDAESNSEAWVAHNFSDFFSIFGELGNSFMSGGSDEEIFKEFAANGSFPLLAKEYSKDGTVLNEWEVLKIQKGKQSPNLFQVPKDYQKMDLNQMMQQNNK